MALKIDFLSESPSNSICRLCLSKDDVSEIDFGDTDGGISLSSKIMTCVALAISPNDLLSKFVCSKCIEMLDMFFEFRETCLSAYVEQCHLLTKGTGAAFGEHSYFDTSPTWKKKQKSRAENPNYTEVDFDDDYEIVEAPDAKVSGSNENCIIVVEPDQEQNITCPIDLFDDDRSAMIKDILEADGYYECDDCNAVFMSITDLTGHVENNKCCNADANKDYSVSQKKNIHIAKKKRGKIPIRILSPDKNLESFSVERKKVITKEDLICEECGKEYKTLKGIVAHRRTHTGEKFACTECKSSFSDPYDLKYHLRIHAANPKYSCKFCKRAFRNPARVVIHERTHTNERPFVCDSCGKSFITIQSLRLHVRIHTGEKPYSCKYCDKKFRSIPSAASHQKRHRDGKRMFQCDFCLRMFETKDDLIKHTDQHKSMAVWRCRHCKLCFKKRSTLKFHIRDRHSILVKSKKSARTQSSELSQLVTETEEVIKCDYCDSLVMPQEMAQHLSVEHANEAIFIESIQYEM